MNRRGFLRKAAACSAPLILSSGVLGQKGRPGANDRIQVGFIGAGQRARWLMQYFGAQVTDAEIVAVADCYFPRCYGKDAGFPPTVSPMPENSGRWAKYQNYLEMFEKEKLDAVWIETTTHARVLAALHAMQAGLDVYAEKPISLTISEGRSLVTAARKLNRILQAGSQQRSIPINRYASELVRTGKIGKIQSVVVCNYLPPMDWKPQPEQPVPEGMDWDRWCNQTEFRPYHTLLHRRWHKWWDYDDGGESWGVSGWGTHGLDQVQCALGTDDTGPVELWTENKHIEDDPDFPILKEEDSKPTLDRKPVIMRYASGTLLKLEEPGRNSLDQLGGTFIGENGKIKIMRGDYTSDPPELRKGAPPITPLGMGEDAFHLKNFLECVRTRQKPNADVEIGHRATSLCHLVSISRKLDRKLRWDPKAELFIGDEEANRMLSRPRRKGYELPKV
jgi:predicted dehydrogenase